METLLRIGLSNAAAALLLALGVVALACVWRRPALLHALWLLVLVKLLSPPLVWLPEPWAGEPENTPSAPPAAADPLRRAGDSSPPSAPGPPEVPAAAADVGPVVVALATSRETAADTPSGAALMEQPAAREGNHAAVAPWWVGCACGLWLAGALAWYSLALGRLWRFRRLLCHAAPAPERLRRRAGKLAERLGLRRCPDVCLIPGPVAPMLWAACGRPRVLFPAALLSRLGPDGQDALLVHELAHLRRRDHWVRWLEFAAAGLHWWNPVLWLTLRELREAEEQCCDAWVTATLPGAGRAYATALLETLDFLSDPPPASPVLASGVGRVSDLKRRLTMIMRGTTTPALGRRGVLAVAVLGGLLLTLLPAWAQGEGPAKPGPQQAAEAPRAAAGMPAAADAAPPAKDAEKERAELKGLEEQLRQKQAEVADLAARVAAARARLRAGTSAAPAEAPRVLVLVSPGTKGDAVQRLLKQLQAAQVGQPLELWALDQASGKILMRLAPAGGPAAPLANVPWAVWVAPALTAQPQYVVAPAPPAPADQRIEDLEKRLKGILDEVEQLRRERGRDAAPGSQPHSSVTPPRGMPSMNQLSRNDFTAPVSPSPPDAEDGGAAGRARVEELEAKAAQVRAERQALIDRRQARGQKAADRVAAWNADAAILKEAVSQAGAAVNEAEVRLEKARAVGDRSAVQVAQAELDLRRAQLEKAKAVLDQKAAEHQASEEQRDREAKEEDARLKQCEDELRKLGALAREQKPRGAEPGRP